MVLVRYVTALTVLGDHYNEIFGSSIWTVRFSSFNPVGAFFALSGFLIFGSYVNYAEQDGGLRKFVKKRARRLLPAYFFVVLLCAFGLFFVSSCNFCEYFLSSNFWKYLVANLTMLNFLEPSLPGVFDGYPVNGSLWTMKIECMCYATVPLVYALLRRYRKHLWIVFAGIGVFSVLYRVVFYELYVRTDNELYNIFSRQMMGQMIFFYTGAAIRLSLTEFVKYKHVAAAVSLLMLFIFNDSTYFMLTLAPIAASVVTLYFSFLLPTVKWGMKLPPISYSIYLFHFPVILLFNKYRVVEYLGIVPTFLIVVSISVLLAYLCWKQVELRFNPVNKR
jgi:peptidoglycan/LPS O-acetylase OafA/YrhL